MVRRWMRNEPEVDVESIVGPVSDTVTLSHTAGAQSHSHTHWGGGGRATRHWHTHFMVMYGSGTWRPAADSSSNSRQAPLHAAAQR